MKKYISIIVLCALLAIAVTLKAQKPGRNVSGVLHPNLAAAQSLIQQAYDKIVEAQRANEYDLGGHAQKAKEHLEAASREIKLAAEVSNQEHRGK